MLSMPADYLSVEAAADLGQPLCTVTPIASARDNDPPARGYACNVIGECLPMWEASALPSMRVSDEGPAGPQYPA